MSLLFEQIPVASLIPRRKPIPRKLPNTIKNNKLHNSPSNRLESFHRPSDITNGSPLRLNSSIFSHTLDGDGNANSNADDLLHLHHHAPLHHRMETDDSISLRLDLPLPHPALHSLPSFAGGKMQFARFLASSGPSWKNKGSGAGVVMLCRRRSWRGRRR
jgi:hypothetical protein